MIDRRTAVFLFNLIQDVNVLRPLIVMASRDFGYRALILVSPKFRLRDLYGIWEAELEILRAENDAQVVFYKDDFEAFGHLQGTGIIFSASESSLPEHGAAHNLFRYAPNGFLRVTLQHGFECVGFRHNDAHDFAYGNKVSFGSDIVCAWQPPAMQPSLLNSQAPKVHVTGPTTVLQMFGNRGLRNSNASGLVCENLHSVRLGPSGELRNQFVSTFNEFCQMLGGAGMEVVLRPHPGGQYVLKNDVKLPLNVTVNNAPIFRLDLSQFAYGISAPSSVLIDMLLADVPTAVWRDPEGGVDTSNYLGLPVVSSPSDWLEFAREASADPEKFIRRQRQFLAEQQIPVDPSDVYQRYAALFHAAGRLSVRTGTSPVERQRLLIVANAHLPTVQVCLEQPLRSLRDRGELITELLTDDRLGEMDRRSGSVATEDWIDQALDTSSPDALIFSRYSGPYASAIMQWAKRHKVPTIYHIDDDLLGVPRILGEAKFAYHNDPARLTTVRSLLEEVDLVYVSTEELKQRLVGYGLDLFAVAGEINCSGRVRRKPGIGPTRVVGYMASADHLPNLHMVLPVIVGMLDRHPDIRFELCGSIPVPEQLERFGSRVTKLAPVANYEEFLEHLGERAWDIGICPLVSNEFNRTKSNNKWVEYTSLGIATVASGGMVYDDCCANGCGLLADGLDEWDAAIERLIVDGADRIAIVERAQLKLQTEFGLPQHQQQIEAMLELARERALREVNKESA